MPARSRFQSSVRVAPGGRIILRRRLIADDRPVRVPRPPRRTRRGLKR